MTDSADPEAALPLDAVLAVDPAVLAGTLLAIPDGENALLRLTDGRRTVGDVIGGSGMEGPLALAALGRLLDAGVLRLVPPGTPALPLQPGGPEGAEWFADPASPPLSEAEPVPEPGPEDQVPSSAAPAPMAGQAGPSRLGRVVTAAVLVGTALLGAAWWASRERDPPPVQTHSRVEELGPGQAPPALSAAEPGPSSAYREAMAAVATRYQAGDLAGAAEACRRAIAIDPSVAAGWMTLGEVTLAAGDLAGARDAFARYLDAEPEGRHAARARVLLERLRP